MGTNNYLTFTPTDTGTNLLSQPDYAVDVQRDVGNQPGVARSKLVNKAMRQSSFITAAVAQTAADQGYDILDDGNLAKLTAQMKATYLPVAPVISKYLTGSGTHNRSVVFYTASANATIGATYTNNAVTFTVLETVAAGSIIKMSGNGSPAASGTLTKSTGTGDATITFYSFRLPMYFKVSLAGGGGGASGAGTGAQSPGSDGNDTTFGTSLLIGEGGTGGLDMTAFVTPAAGGAASLGTGPVGVAFTGGWGSGGGAEAAGVFIMGGGGGESLFPGSGKGTYQGDGTDAVPNTGAGGGGGAAGGSPAGVYTGAGGGGGGYVIATIFSPAASYPYSVGTGGAGGAGDGAAGAGGDGADGIIIVEECFQ